MLRGPMNRSGKLHALLATARVANLPSVVSNVWLGLAIGMVRYGTADVPWMEAAGVAAVGVCLYLSGNFGNDWFDRDWDARHRPERGLPGGVFSPALYLTLAIVLGTAGLMLAAWLGLRTCIVAASIACWIVVYTFVHKRTAWAVIPMGLCRGLLPVLGFTVYFPFVDGVWPVACGLFCYVMGLSLSARYESMAEPPVRVAVLARALLLGTAVLVSWGNRGLMVDRSFIVAGVLPYLAWVSVSLRYRRKPVPLLVSSLLAGIPLVDWMVLLPVSLMLMTRGGVDHFGLACFALPPVAFVSALLLQRLAPAT